MCPGTLLSLDFSGSIDAAGDKTLAKPARPESVSGSVRLEAPLLTPAEGVWPVLVLVIGLHSHQCDRQEPLCSERIYMLECEQCDIHATAAGRASVFSRVVGPMIQSCGEIVTR